MSTVNLVVIARNESRCIERCLHSAAPFVNSMIVLDTGSTDDTVPLALAAGARVASFEWTGNFSEARNAALALSESSWNLVLDADEWIDNAVQAPDLRAFISGSQKIGLIRIRSEFDLNGRVEHSDTWIPRLLPRRVRYRGRIHEQPVHQLPQVRLDVLVHHDGYQPERVRSKRGRNVELLTAELQQNPHDAYMHFQMGCQHEAANEWGPARGWYAQAIEHGAMDRPFAHDLAVRYLHVLARCTEYEEAVAWAGRIEARWPRSSDVFFAIGSLCLDLAAIDPDNAQNSWLPSAQAAWMRCLEIGEHGDGYSHVIGRGSFLAAHNLAVIHRGLGDTLQAEKYQAMAMLRPN